MDQLLPSATPVIPRKARGTHLPPPAGTYTASIRINGQPGKAPPAAPQIGPHAPSVTAQTALKSMQYSSCVFSPGFEARLGPFRLDKSSDVPPPSPSRHGYAHWFWYELEVNWYQYRHLSVLRTRCGGTSTTSDG
ncbi:hypothetical protein TsFJ059_003254 [Trichoderma semiorbis]|uniref:Uncharacterized protein n=1 Tax=Trichoderma semiorbis TaxID=1491008 RepID=A0A9P8HIJ9_9HYPO|nr:hypothetical protein TsFJ059_003254 [Trichoderma semiorbis]